MSNIVPFDQFKRAQRIALISIVSVDSLSQTAAVARVTDRTIRNWRKQPVFQEALAEASRDFFSACRSQVNASLVVAFKTLVHTAGSSWSDSERLKAALSLLDRVAHTEISAIPFSENDKPL